MNFYCLIALVVLQAITVSHGLNCWVCENQRSNKDCTLNGGLVECRPNEDACQNEIRRDDQGMLISKRCKQANACLNNFMQNLRAAFKPTQCNSLGSSSVCRCCCSEDGCNQQALFDCMQPVTCEPQDRPQNGSVICDDNNNMNSICRFTCKLGFQLVGEETSVCETMENGDMPAWSSPPPTCVPNIPNSPERCLPLITSLANGTVFCSNDNEAESECLFLCDQDFVLEGEETVTCEEKGIWSGPVPECLPKTIQCQERDSFSINGEFFCTDSNNLGSECHYGCNTGFQLVGDVISTCLDVGAEYRGAWSSDTPKCVVPTNNTLFCPTSQVAPGNGDVFCRNGNAVGSDCLFTCNIGYVLEGSKITTCSSEREWTFDAPTCTQSDTCTPCECSTDPMNTTSMMQMISKSIDRKDYIKYKTFLLLSEVLEW